MGFFEPLILVSCSTTFLVHCEQRRARQETLTKDEYIKYQLLKLFVAFELSFVSLIIDFAIKDPQCDMQHQRAQCP